ncbi:hypothetical protein [Streptomyces sp. NPDC088707]
MPHTIGPLRGRAGAVSFGFFADSVTTVPSARVTVTSEAGGTS